MAGVPEEHRDLPLNEDVLALNAIYPALSFQECELLYSRYGGTVSHALNRIIDDLDQSGFNDIVDYVSSLASNKENERKSDTMEKGWQPVTTKRTRSSASKQVPLRMSQNSPTSPSPSPKYMTPSSPFRDSTFFGETSPRHEILLCDHLPDLQDPSSYSPISSPGIKRGTDIDIENDLVEAGSERSRRAAVFPEYALSGRTTAFNDFDGDNVIDDPISFNNTAKRKSGRSRHNSGTELCPLMESEPLAAADLSLCKAQSLYNLFPDCSKSALIELFEYFSENVNDTTNYLLESGYSMTGDPDKKRNSVEVPGEAIVAINSESNESVSLDEEDKFKRLGARPKEYPRPSSEEKRDSPSPDSEDMFTPVDGPDWVDLKLSDGFVRTIATMYGEPHGKNPSSLSDVEKTIRLPPTLAFELFKYLSLNISRKENELSDAQYLSSVDQDVNMDESDVPFSSDYVEDSEMEQLLNTLNKINLAPGNYNPLDSSAIMALEEKIVSQNSVGNKSDAKHILERTMAQKIKVAQLKASFPSLNDIFIDEIFVQNNLDYERTLGSLMELYPAKYVDPSLKTNSSTDLLSNELVSYDPDKVSRMTTDEKAEMTTAADFWKSKCDEYSSASQSYKGNAQAQRGRSEVFSYYLVQASEMQRRLKEAQKEYWWYKVISLNAGNRDPNQIDLHGLSVTAALEVVEKFLQNRSAWYKNCNLTEDVHLNIITGRGRHSVNNIAKINPAVRKYLSSHHYSYIDQHGNFLVHLTKNKGKRGKW